jgi:hypothetical protein
LSNQKRIGHRTNLQIKLQRAGLRMDCLILEQGTRLARRVWKYFLHIVAKATILILR